MGMYKGQKETIQLCCTNNQTIISHIFEKFGKDILIQDINEDTFTIAVPIEISPVFYGWLFQWTPQIQVLSPLSVKQQYQDMLIIALEKNK
jgi:predicted DNA-binding transcriptional regulator YafY